MPRIARVSIDGVPHHITQRGNRGGDVFFSSEDRFRYLKWLEEYCNKYEVDVLAYCLMTNHVHLIMQPKQGLDISRVLKPLHMRYAQRMNRINDWQGHFWQGRFFSSPLDDTYLMAAMRYVERNPVRAGMVDKAEKYPWSSAADHCGIKTSSLLVNKLPEFLPDKNGWSSWLSNDDDDETKMQTIRSHVAKGLPCGEKAFIKKLEGIVGRGLICREPGRPVKG